MTASEKFLGWLSFPNGVILGFLIGVVSIIAMCEPQVSDISVGENEVSMTVAGKRMTYVLAHDGRYYRKKESR